MNILLLTQFFSNTRGGGEYVFNLLAKKLVENNHSVFVITNKIVGEIYDSYKNIEIIFVPPVLDYKGGLPPGFVDNIKYSINAIIQGHKVIKNKKIDIIHSNNFAPALAGSILSSITSKPHITTIHDIFSLCGMDYWRKWGIQSNISKINVWLAPFFEKTIIRLRSDGIHTVSEATRDDLIKLGTRKPIYVIHNSIEMNTVNEISVSKVLQFVYVGRLVFYKNLEVAIRAIEIVKKTYPKIKLTIIGDGPHRNALEEIVRNLNLEANVEFKGYVSPQEKSRLLAESVALVFPSLCEGFGLVILEAYEQRKPVLVSDIRPMSDIVLNGITGYVLNPHDEKAWAQCILEIIRDPPRVITIGKNGHHMLMTSYNQDSMYQKIIDMYKQVKNIQK